MEAHGPAFCLQPVRAGCVNVGGRFTAYQINRIYLVLLELDRGRQINGMNARMAFPVCYSALVRKPHLPFWVYSGC